MLARWSHDDPDLPDDDCKVEVGFLIFKLPGRFFRLTPASSAEAAGHDRGLSGQLSVADCQLDAACSYGLLSDLVSLNAA